MKRKYAKPWRPTATFIWSTLVLATLAGVTIWVAFTQKEQILIFVDKVKPFLEKINNNKSLTKNHNTKAGPLSDAITLKKIVELSNLKKEY